MAKEIKASAKNVKGSAQKARIVANAVRGMDALYAMDVLKYMRKGAAPKVRKVVQSAIANATNNDAMAAENLVISQIFVDEAPTYKRFRSESKGRVRRIMKRNSSITVFVADKNELAKEKNGAKGAAPAAKAIEAETAEQDSADKASKPAVKPAAAKATAAKKPAAAKAAKSTAKKSTKSNTTKK